MTRRGNYGHLAVEESGSPVLADPMAGSLGLEVFVPSTATDGEWGALGERTRRWESPAALGPDGARPGWTSLGATAVEMSELVLSICVGMPLIVIPLVLSILGRDGGLGVLFIFSGITILGLALQPDEAKIILYLAWFGALLVTAQAVYRVYLVVTSLHLVLTRPSFSLDPDRAGATPPSTDTSPGRCLY